ncbi:type III-B CRISPR module-associated protein Cmr5 [Candidatus Parcubacteria bacterium]|nr:MAG: type III-B CRISPR module-associated protein Cmr5 [Candidatus Parcubacteria bacterium]
MHTLEQKLAEKVYRQVTQLQPKTTLADEYGGMANKLPVLIRQAGLVQALAYVQARGKDGAKKLLEDLAQTLEYNSVDELLRESRKAALLEYMRLTHKATVALTWYKRFAQSVLGVEPGGE